MNKIRTKTEDKGLQRTPKDSKDQDFSPFAVWWKMLKQRIFGGSKEVNTVEDDDSNVAVSNKVHLKD
jgi:hypothetical protein